MSWQVGFSDLTSEQQKIVELSTEEHHLVLGPVGSGKTLLLLHRAAYLAEKHGTAQEDVRIFVLTDILRESTKLGLRSLNLPEEMVFTFDDWCRFFFRSNISENLPRVYIDGRIDFEKTRLGVLEALKKRPELRGSLDIALVDDGQDLPPEGYDILKFSARHITVFADSHPRIFRRGDIFSGIMDRRLGDFQKTLLSGHHRNSRNVSQLASYFLADEEARDEYLEGSLPGGEGSEKPLLYVAPSFEHEIDRLADAVLQRQFGGESLGIVIPNDRLVHRTAKELSDRRVFSEKAIVGTAQNVVHAPVDFSNNLPKITTYSMARGLTFDSVFLPHLTDDSFSGIETETRQAWLFHGIARARKWVYLSTVKGQEMAEFSLMKAAKAKNHLVIQYKS